MWTAPKLILKLFEVLITVAPASAPPWSIILRKAHIDESLAPISGWLPLSLLPAAVHILIFHKFCHISEFFQALSHFVTSYYAFPYFPIQRSIKCCYILSHFVMLAQRSIKCCLSVVSQRHILLLLLVQNLNFRSSITIEFQ